MGIGKKHDGASGEDHLWPDDDVKTENDWDSIIRNLIRHPPLGLGMTLQAVGELTFDQLKFLINPEKPKQEIKSRKEADRQGCITFVKMMKRTGWSARRLREIPLDILLEHYAIDSGFKHQNKHVVQMQLNLFLRKLGERNQPKAKVVKA